MSIKNDGNLIPDTIMSPSNFHVEYVANEDTIYNGTIDKQTMIKEGLRNGMYVDATTTGSRTVSSTLKQLIADGELKVFSGAPVVVKKKSKSKKKDA